MNYFEFFDIPITLKVDELSLKQAFYKNSKKYHPDFYTLESEEKQTEVLELSSFNNKAYKTLSNFDKRIKYVLELQGVLAEEGQNKLPQSFLMEMMDINEALMELQFEPDASKQQNILNQIKTLEESLLLSIKPILTKYNGITSNKADLIPVKDFYLKKRYLLRILENLNKFAAH